MVMLYKSINAPILIVFGFRPKSLSPFTIYHKNSHHYGEYQKVYIIYPFKLPPHNQRICPSSMVILAIIIKYLACKCTAATLRTFNPHVLSINSTTDIPLTFRDDNSPGQNNVHSIQSSLVFLAVLSVLCSHIVFEAVQQFIKVL